MVYYRRGSRISSWRGAHLKKLRREEGGAKIFGIFRVKKITILRPRALKLPFYEVFIILKDVTMTWQKWGSKQALEKRKTSLSNFTINAVDILVIDFYALHIRTIDAFKSS
jgi:hypothetical protein